MADLWVKRKAAGLPLGESRHAGSIGYGSGGPGTATAKALYTRSPGENKGPLPVEKKSPLLSYPIKSGCFRDKSAGGAAGGPTGGKSPQGLALQRKRRRKKNFFGPGKKIFVTGRRKSRSGRACRACSAWPVPLPAAGKEAGKTRGKGPGPLPLSFRCVDVRQAPDGRERPLPVKTGRLCGGLRICA